MTVYTVLSLVILGVIVAILAFSSPGYRAFVGSAAILYGLYIIPRADATIRAIEATRQSLLGGLLGVLPTSRLALANAQLDFAIGLLAVGFGYLLFVWAFLGYRDLEPIQP